MTRPARPAAWLLRSSWLALVACGAAAAVLLLWPWGGQVRTLHIWVWVRLWRLIGSPDWFTPEVAEQLANVAILMVPLAALTVVAWRVRWWWIAIAGSLVGVCVEVVQWLVLPARVVDPIDAVFNAVGAIVGVAAGAWLRSRVTAADTTEVLEVIDDGAQTPPPA